VFLPSYHSFPFQIAKSQGAFVATTCSTSNVEFVTKELGADQAIDYKKEK
jgi:NADPH:quinone reductase-like Zn-dependent oxidoreductase